MRQLNGISTKLPPAQRLTEERARQYAQLFVAGANQHKWQLRISNLDKFIKYWGQIRKCLHVAVYSNVAWSAVHDLQYFDAEPGDWAAELVVEADRYVQEIDFHRSQHANKTPLERFQALCPALISTGIPETTRWVAAALMGVNPRAAFPGRESALLDVLRDNPGFYAATRDYFPFDHWARISKPLSAYLLKRAEEAHWKTACTASLVAHRDIE
jgi:hypothetical protein